MRESRMTRNCHVRFGERSRETHSPRDEKVRSAPTLCSPLLMNVALHGMETMLRQGYPIRNAVEKPLFVRYADDFVIFHSNLEKLQEAADRVTTWLQEIGLNLSPKKTR